jgi:hypothetical protein
MLSAAGRGMWTRRLFTVALASAASTLFACGSSEPSRTSVPDHPTACNVTATLALGDGGIGHLTALPSHSFTVLIDWSANQMTGGSEGDAFQVPLAPKGDGWSTQAPISLQPSRYSYPAVAYTSMTLRPTAGGCTGEATGNYSYLGGDVVYGQPFTATLVGVADSSPPQATVPATDVDPLRFGAVFVNELLPKGTTAELVDDTGFVIPMASLPRDESAAYGVSGFQMQNMALVFGRTYTVRVLPALVDLAGNTAPSPTFATLSAPGLFAQDGFESAPNLLSGGDVQVVDATTLPVPKGGKALRILPSSGWTCDDGFTVRMAVPMGASAIKFTALDFGAAGTSSLYVNYMLIVGVPNGSSAVTYWSSLAKTPLTKPWKDPLPGSTSYTYGDLAQYTVPLPAGTQGEVMFDLSRHCVEPPSLIAGLVIDDLRVE